MSSQGGTYPTYSRFMNDGCALDANNLRTNSPSYYNGVGTTFCLPSSGKWFIENYVGNTYAAYPVQGFINHQYTSIDEGALSLYEAAGDQNRGNPNSGIGIDMNNGHFGYYAATGTSKYNFKEPDGTSIYSTNVKLVAHALDLDNGRYWVGTAFADGTSTAWSWFGNGNSTTGTDDPTNASTGLDLSNLSDYHNDWKRFSFFHGPNNVAADPYSIINFGQDSSFAENMTPGGNTDANGRGDYIFPLPSGYLGLCSANLPIDEDLDPNKAKQRLPCNVVEYTGTGGTQSITGVGFQPDLVIIKRVDSSTGGAPAWFDSSRGVLNELSSNGYGDESTTANSLTAFGTDGFTVGSDKSISTGKYDALCWKCNGGTTSTNTDGTIASTVQVNQAAGFSIVTWTGTGTNGTVGHGLGVKPAFIIIKNRGTDGEHWDVWHQYMNVRSTSTDNQRLRLDQDSALVTSTNTFDVSGITATTIGFGGSGSTNASTKAMVAWVWAEKDQYSCFGSYKGSGTASGTTASSPAVPMNFKPRILWIKRTDSSEPWLVYYREIEGYLSSAAKGESGNPKSGYWVLNSNAGETYYENIYLHGNGFSCGDNNTAEVNADGGSYIFCAWGETPMRYGTAF